jgi:CHAT domain-containing protein/tetratricopeptide (TPR) repeat protein
MAVRMAVRWGALLGGFLGLLAAPALSEVLLDYRAALQEAAKFANANDFEGAGRVTEAALAALDAGDAPGAVEARAFLLNGLARWQAGAGQGRQAYETALRALDQLDSHDPRRWYFLRDVGILAFRLGHCEAALEAYAKARSAAASTSREAEVALNQAQVFLHYGLDQEAADALVVALSHAETALPAMFTRAALELGRFDHRAAGDWLDQARAVLDRRASAASAETALMRALEAEWWAKSAWLARSSGDFTAAERHIAEADRLLADRPDEDRSGLLNEHATLEFFRGRFAVAERHYRQVLEAQTVYADEAMPRAHAYYQLAVTLRGLGDLAQAEAFFTLAEIGYRHCPRGDPWRLALLLGERNRLRLDLGDVSGAEADATAMRTLVESFATPRPVLAAYAQAAEAEVLARRGRLDEALLVMTDATERLRQVRGDTSEDLVPGYVRLSEWALESGDRPRARADAERALDLRRRAGAASLWGEARAWALVAASSDPTDARYVESLIGIVTAAESYLAAASGAEDQVRRELRASRYDIVERALTPIAPASSSPAAITPALVSLIQVPQLAETAAVLGTAHALAGASDPALALQLVERAGLLERRRVLDVQFSAAQQDPLVAAGLSESLLAEIGGVQARLHSLDAGLRQRDPRLAELLVPRTVPVEHLQALLHDDEALYLQLVTRVATIGVLLRPHGVVMRVAPRSGRDLVRRDVRRLRDGLDLQKGLDRQPFDRRTAHALYLASLGPFEAELAGVRQLVVVPDDAFQAFPWSVMVVDPAADAGGNVLDRHALTVVPSASAFAALRGNAAAPQIAAEPFIGFGDPVLQGGRGTIIGLSTESLISEGLRGPSPARVQQLEPLPQTSRELTAIAASLGASQESVFVRERATRAEVHRVGLANHRIISFATHGLLAGDFRGLAEPALVLTPGGRMADGSLDNGLLTASEIASLRTSADLVLLSACNTGRAETVEGAYGLSALARAFFSAGARGLLVSHWAVESEATVRLVTHFMELAAQEPDASKSRLWQQTMQWMASGGAGERYRDPAYWAAFVLMGDAAPFAVPGQPWGPV